MAPIDATPSLAVRGVTPADGDAVFALAQRFATSFTPERAAFDRALASLTSNPSSLLAVAELGHHVRGYVLGFQHPTFFANGPVAWVEEIMVDESVRRRGVGSSLMGHFESWAQTRGAKLIALATRRAAPFYAALGYEESAAYFRKAL